MNTCVILHSCDKYHYILDEFFEHFAEHFPHEDFTIYHITETKEYLQPYVRNLVMESSSWSERFVKALELIEEENFLYVQEDMIFYHIDQEAVKAAVTLHEANVENNFFITKLGTFHDFKLQGINYYLGNHPLWLQLDGPYTMSHQPPAIFNKEFFLKTLEREHDVWTHECQVSDEINNGRYGEVNIMCVGESFYPINKSAVMSSHHAIMKGQYIPYDPAKYS